MHSAYTQSQTTDVVVVGGGPAGLATAIAVRQHGLHVTVVDAARPPLDKACGEGLMPDALAALERLGVRLTPAHGAPFTGIRFVAGEQRVEAHFPHGPGLGVRRPLLHQCLVERAQEVGVSLCWGSPVRTFTPALLYGAGQRLAYRWLVAADGLHSTLRRHMGLHQLSVERRRLGFQCHYRVPPWSTYVELYWHQRCQACVTPVGPDEVCVCLLTEDRRWRFCDVFQLFPQLAERLGGVAPSTPVRGAVTGTYRLRRVYQDNMALVGDAAGSVDAVTGEGLCLAFQQAEHLAAALVTGDLSHYAAAHRRLLRRPRLMASLMLLMDDHGWVRRRAMQALAMVPEAFSYLLDVHIGHRSYAHVGWRVPLAFGWKFLAG